MNREGIVSAGFLVAGATNIGSVLLFSLGYSNATLFTIDPTVITPFALLMVQLWGFAAIVVSQQALQLPWLSLVFALEKLSYVAVWLYWLTTSATLLGDIYRQDLLSGLFFSIYGPFDLLLMLFFLWAFREGRQQTVH